MSESLQERLEQAERDVGWAERELVRIETAARERAKREKQIKDRCKQLGLDPEKLDEEAERLEAEALAAESELADQLEEFRRIISPEASDE